MKSDYKKINITIDENLLNKFKIYCAKNGMKVSSRISHLIKNDIGGEHYGNKKES